MKKSNFLSKWLFTLAFLTISSNIYSFEARAAFHNISLEEETTLSIDEIISTYCLEDIEILIRLYEKSFLQYYNVVMKNPTFSYRDQVVILKDFRTFVSYFDISYGIQKIQDYKIVVNDDLCEQEQIKGRHNLNTNSTLIRSDASNYVRSHENKHYYFEHPSKESLTLDNGEMISTIAIHEAIATDLASLDFTADGFSTEYTPLVQALQAFYYMYGRDEVISCFAQPDFLEQLVSSFHEIGLDDDFIKDFFDSLTGVMNSEKVLEFYYDEKIKEQHYYDLSECILKIYEHKTGRTLKDSEEMQAILFGLVNSISFDNVSGNMIYKKELKQLKYGAPFFDIDLMNLKSLQARVSNSEFFIKAFYTPALDISRDDVILYSFDQGTLEKIEGYNSIQYDVISHVLSYGITDESVIDVAVRSNLFLAYETIINREDLLSSDEKLYLIQHFADFMKLHPSFFTLNPSSEFLQVLLARTVSRSNATSEVFQIIEDEDILYRIGGADYIAELKGYGIQDFEMQKFYIQNMTIFEGYVDGLRSNMNLGLTEEDIRRIILYFPNYVHNYPILQNMNEYECYDYVFKSIKSRSKITLALDLYDLSNHSSNKELARKR